MQYMTFLQNISRSIHEVLNIGKGVRTTNGFRNNCSVYDAQMIMIKYTVEGSTISRILNVSYPNDVNKIK